MLFEDFNGKADEEIYRIVTACMKKRHFWKDGWVCEHCGKKRADIEEFKKKLKNDMRK